MIYPKRFCYCSSVVQYVRIFCLVSCIIYLVSCFLFPVSCLLSPVSCLMCHVYCYTVFSHWIVGAVGREVRIDAWEVRTRVKVQCGLLFINFPQTFLQLMPKKVLKIPKLSTTNTWKSVKIPRRRGWTSLCRSEYEWLWPSVTAGHDMTSQTHNIICLSAGNGEWFQALSPSISTISYCIDGLSGPSAIHLLMYTLLERFRRFSLYLRWCANAKLCVT